MRFVLPFLVFFVPSFAYAESYRARVFNGTNVIYLDDSFGLLVGKKVCGDGIPKDSSIVSFGPAIYSSPSMNFPYFMVIDKLVVLNNQTSKDATVTIC